MASRITTIVTSRAIASMNNAYQIYKAGLPSCGLPPLEQWNPFWFNFKGPHTCQIISVKKRSHRPVPNIRLGHQVNHYYYGNLASFKCRCAVEIRFYRALRNIQILHGHCNRRRIRLETPRRRRPSGRLPGSASSGTF